MSYTPYGELPSTGRSGAQQVEEGIMLILQGLGYDLDDQHLKRTPERVARWLAEFRVTGEISLDQLEGILAIRFEESHQELVAVKNVPFVSLCAHHMLPFTGLASIGYIPNGRVVGISKLARALQYIAKQLSLQERITEQLADALFVLLQPKGVMVVIEAEHQCMSIRGVEAHNSSTVTSAVRGVFRDSLAARQEFISLCTGATHVR